MDQSFYVYALCRPSGSVCYIGKGRGKRWKANGSSGNPHLRRIVRNAGGDLPKFKLREGLSEHDAFALEKGLIHLLGKVKNGGPLVNITDGGDGVSGLRHSLKTIRKLRQKQKGNKYRLGQHPTPETRAKLSASKKGRPLSLAHRKALSRAQKKRPPCSEETRRKISAAKTGKKWSPERRAILRAANRSREPEVRKRISRAVRAAMKRPGVLDKYRLAQTGKKHSEETKAKMSLAQKRRYLA